MKCKNGFGQQYINSMLHQITQFRFMATKNRNITNPTSHQNYDSFKDNSKFLTSQSVNLNRPKSSNTTNTSQRLHGEKSKQHSLTKKLKKFKERAETQLKNPFCKIHIRRPESAQTSYLLESQPSPRKQKDNNKRYEQLKQYYETKYLSEEAHTQPMKICQSEFEERSPGIFFNRTRPVSCRKNYWQRRN